ncbi:MAG: hypothetical protein IRZ02_04375 [Acidothermus sp.]|nr:hypothetical protein [Acidothermus sp.]MCL6538785.1 hypothetical protein [Acidothermus sp.]
MPAAASGSVCALAAAAVLLTACTGSPTRPAPSTAPSSSAEASTAAASPSPSGSPSPLLPADCVELLPLQVVEQAIGVNLLGRVTYLRAAAVPQSGRTGRVTCGYGTPVATPSSGTPTPTGPPLVQVSYITYVDAKTAAGRVALTVQTDGQHATTTKTDVDGKPAWILFGQEWDELVMGDGARTIVVEISPRLLPQAKVGPALIALARHMLAFGSTSSSSSSASP